MIPNIKFSVYPLLFILLCWLAASTGLNAATITFEPDDAVVLNPERGLAKYMIVGEDSIGSLAQLRADNHTIAWGIIKLDNYQTTSVIPAAKLNEIKAWLDAVRLNRVKAVLRVAYHEVQNFSPPDATISVQEAHLTQLGSEAFVPYEDVIIALQAGGIGAYGEWYYTTPDLITAQSRKRLLDKMHQVTADDAFVLVRTPYYKQVYEATAGQDDRVLRTGHYNDCFLSSADDTGTYGCYPSTQSCPTITQLQSYTATDSNLVPVGGETCNATPLNDCPATLAAMEFYGYSFINTLWFSSIRTKWEEQGCFDDITKKLGYRFELVSATVPDSVSAGADVSVSVTLKNTGWAPLYHDRPVYIRVMDANGVKQLLHSTGAQPKDWLASNETYTFTTTFQVPDDLDTTAISLSLWMPDSNTVNSELPEYSIRFANTEVWDSVNGDNVLATGIPVVSTTNNCDVQYSLPNDQWVTLTLPCQPPQGTTVGDLFSDDILLNGQLAEYGRDWIVYIYDIQDPDAAGYINPGVNGTLDSGQGFWIIQRSNNSAVLDLPIGSQKVSRDTPEAAGCTEPLGCIGLPLTGRANTSVVWQLLGNPLPAEINTDALQLSTTSGACSEQGNACDLSSAFLANVANDVLWHYSAGGYQPLTGSTAIGIWYGFWLSELPAAAGNSPELLWPISAAR